MNAVEFVKKYGWFRAYQILKYSNHKHKRFLADGISVTYNEIDIPDWTSIDDLNKLVDSRNVVDAYGGLIEAKNHINSPFLIKNKDSDYLEQAIADVEKCQ